MYEGCKLIAVEGPDKLGKTTQCIRLASALNGSTYQKIPSRDGVTYDRIYEMLKTGEALEEPYYFQSLQGMNRLIWQRQMLPMLAQQNEYIILDRWNLSAWIYGKATGMTDRQLDIISKGMAKPDLCFIFQGTAHERPGQDDVYESNSKLQTEAEVRYNQWADDNPDIAIKINANRSMEDVTSHIVQEVEKWKIQQKH